MKKLLLYITTIVALLGFASVAIASSLPVGGQTYYLAGAGVTTTQTTIQLTSFKTADGTLLTMANFGTIGYGTLESQTVSRIEFISFTGVTQNSNGTATLTGVTRGVGFVYPYASTLSLEHSHAGGANFIISNTPEFYYNEFAMQNNSNVFTYPTASSSPATKGYVDTLAFGGVIPAATFIAGGVIQLGTGLQAASSTVVGSTGYNLVVPTSIATSTFNAATAPLKVVVTNNQGTIDPNFLNLNGYTGSATFATTTTIGSTYAFDIGKHEFVASTTGTWTVPNGIHTVWARIVGGGGSGGSGSPTGAAGGSGGYVEGPLAVSGTLSFTIGTGGAGVSTNASGNVGTATTVGNMTANGGNGGGFCNGSTQAGGTGGTATGGYFTSTGNSGVFCTAVANANGPITPSVLGSSAGNGSAGSAGTTVAGGPGEMILTW